MTISKAELIKKLMIREIPAPQERDKHYVITSSRHILYILFHDRNAVEVEDALRVRGLRHASHLAQPRVFHGRVRTPVGQEIYPRAVISKSYVSMS